MGTRGEFSCLWEWERFVSSGNSSTNAWLVETWANAERHLISPGSEWNGPVWSTELLLLLQDFAHKTRRERGSQENSTERKLCCCLRKGNIAGKMITVHFVFIPTTNIHKKNQEVPSSCWENKEGYPWVGTCLLNYKIPLRMMEIWSSFP